MGLPPLGAGWLPYLERATAVLGVDRLVDTSAREKLVVFFDLIAEWNRGTNLTGARSPEELVDLVLADAAVIAGFELSALQRCDPEPVSDASHSEIWVDVGSGMGAPGVPLAILLPRIRMRLVEPRQKRAAFLRAALAELALARVTVEQRGSSTLGAATAAVAMSRATFAPAEWLAEGARLATRGVWVLLARDPTPVLEGFTQAAEITYSWPLTGTARRAVRYAPDTGFGA